MIEAVMVKGLAMLKGAFPLVAIPLFFPALGEVGIVSESTGLSLGIVCTVIAGSVTVTRAFDKLNARLDRKFEIMDEHTKSIKALEKTLSSRPCMFIDENGKPYCNVPKK